MYAVGGVSEDRDAITVLVSHFAAAEARLELRLKQLPWGGAADYEAFVIDAANDLKRVSRGTVPAVDGKIVDAVKPHSVYVVRLQRRK